MVSTKTTIQRYIDSNGNMIKIGKVIGKGGEGTVYEVKGKPGTVLKIYHKYDEERSKKITLMTNLKNERLLKYTAWPTETVKDARGKVIGFLMPTANGKEVHILYSPKNRLNEFDHVSLPFLIHTAANIARAFAVVHEIGQVIGDVNHANIVVSNDGTIKLIDCDSFQIGRNRKLFLCKVGVGTHQPPELQSKSLSKIIRTNNHDHFGLAIIIFQLLFMGRHPFSGRYLGSGVIDMPIETAIEQYRFAYGKNAKHRQIEQPPGTLSLDFYSKELANLFEKAFSQASAINRPKAVEWIDALDKLKRDLISCPINQAHSYSSAHHQCPWCEYEAKTGLVLFSTMIKTNWNKDIALQLDLIWKRISKINPPSNQELPDPNTYFYTPLVEIIKAGTKLKRIKTIRILEAMMIGIISILLTLYGGMGIYPLGGLIVSVLISSRKIKTKQFNEVQKGYESINQKWESVLMRWKKEAHADNFYTKLNELKEYKSKYEEIPNIHAKKLKQLEKEQRNHQLNEYLDKFYIQSSNIDHIGLSRKTVLQSYGIETAKDISKQSLLMVPGFGPFTSELIEWRKNIEKHFYFDPKKGIPRSDLYSLEKEMFAIKSELEKKLTDGEAELNHIKNNILNSREYLKREAEECVKILGQLKANVKYLKKVL
jgi:DNA-binding helix-hairpin-helix protein with protein kinase domain